MEYAPTPATCRPAARVGTVAAPPSRRLRPLQASRRGGRGVLRSTRSIGTRPHYFLYKNQAHVTKSDSVSGRVRAMEVLMRSQLDQTQGDHERPVEGRHDSWSQGAHVPDESRSVNCAELPEEDEGVDREAAFRDVHKNLGRMGLCPGTRRERRNDGGGGAATFGCAATLPRPPPPTLRPAQGHDLR